MALDSVEQYLTAGGLVRTGEALHEGGLASAVVSHETEDLTCVQLDVDVIQCNNSAVLL